MGSDLQKLLEQGREIWGDLRMQPDEIVVALGVVYGDICRQVRDGVDDEQMQKELGNALFSLIRWIDDFGYDAEECIERAMLAQQAFQEKAAK